MDEMPSEMMIDTMVHTYIRENRDYLDILADLSIDVYISVVQSNEIRNGLDTLEKSREQNIIKKIELVDSTIQPEETSIETSDWGGPWGHNWGGNIGKIYEELMQPHDNIGRPDRADAVGAEAAVVRKIPFVTEDHDLKRRMGEYDYEKYVLPWSEFRERLDEEIGTD